MPTTNHDPIDISCSHQKVACDKRNPELHIFNIQSTKRCFNVTRNPYLKISHNSQDTPEMHELADRPGDRDDRHNDTGRQSCEYHHPFRRWKLYAPQKMQGE